MIFINVILVVVLIIVIIGIIVFIFKVLLVYFLGVNDDMIGYVFEYMNILFVFGFVFILENILSIFVCNDGDFNLLMIVFIVIVISNVILNYLFLFVFEWGVMGFVFVMMIVIIIGVFILIIYFFKKLSCLKFVKVDWNKVFFKKILVIGLLSFLVEVGVFVFMLGYNILIVVIVGIVGVVVFLVFNYMYSVILMLFFGMGFVI